MTTERRDEKDTAFGDWFRHRPGLDSKVDGFDAENIDYIWFAYRDGKIMVIEEKCNMAFPSAAQQDTHGVVSFALEYACAAEASFPRYFPGRLKKLSYRGYHIVQFQNTCPTDGKTYLDAVEVSEDELAEFMRFEAADHWYARRHPRLK